MATISLNMGTLYVGTGDRAMVYSTNISNTPTLATPANLAFTVATPAANGVFIKDNPEPGLHWSTTTTFTLADILNGYVAFLNTGTVTGADSATLTWSYSGTQSGTVTLPMQISTGIGWQDDPTVTSPTSDHFYVPPDFPTSSVFIQPETLTVSPGIS